MEIWIWLGFLALIFVFLALDLGIFHKNPHAITFRESLLWTTIWILTALLFNAFLYYAYQEHWLGIGDKIGTKMSGREAALNFFTGYIIEKSLSIDNIFVIAMIFAYFNVPQKFQHRILYWGIIGALVFRGVMIAAGTALIYNFVWITYVFGALLIYSAIKLFTDKEEGIDPQKNPVIKFIRKIYPVSDSMEDGKFFTRINGVRAVTPIFVVLMVIETSDVMFAIDSIPAIFAVTTDPFLVFTSNVFAILGLRSLYFVLASVLDKFRYLKLSLVFVLGFVGVKMLLIHYFKFPIGLSLGVIIGILTIGVIASVIANKRDEKHLNNPYPENTGSAIPTEEKQADEVVRQ
jgi:tellurite resistance protein TerC